MPDKNLSVRGSGHGLGLLLSEPAAQHAGADLRVFLRGLANLVRQHFDLGRSQRGQREKLPPRTAPRCRPRRLVRRCRFGARGRQRVWLRAPAPAGGGDFFIILKTRKNRPARTTTTPPRRPVEHFRILLELLEGCQRRGRRRRAPVRGGSRLRVDSNGRLSTINWSPRSVLNPTAAAARS